MTKKHFVLKIVVLAAVGALVGAAPLFSQESSAPGVLVSSVAADGPADKAGVRVGDVILSVDQEDVTMPLDLVRAIRSRKAGESIELGVMRGNETETVSVIPQEQNGRVFIGIGVTPSVADIGRNERARPRLEDLSGAFVVEVVEGSPAASAGLEPHDVILSVNGEKVEGEEALSSLIGKHAAGETVTLSVQSDGREQRDVQVTLQANPEKADRGYLGVQYVAVPARSDWNMPDSHMPRSDRRGSDAL